MAYEETDRTKRQRTLVERIKADRLERRMTWKPYALFLGVRFPTLMKIVNQVTKKPSELTVALIQTRIALPKTRKEAYRGADVTRAGGAATADDTIPTT